MLEGCIKKLFCLKATRQRFSYFLFDGPEEHVPAKQRVEELIRQSGLPDSFSFVKVYAAWRLTRSLVTS